MYFKEEKQKEFWKKINRCGKTGFIKSQTSRGILTYFSPDLNNLNFITLPNCVPLHEVCAGDTSEFAFSLDLAFST